MITDVINLKPTLKLMVCKRRPHDLVRSKDHPESHEFVGPSSKEMQIVDVEQLQVP